MDLNSITVADFKAQFPRGFPYLPTYDNDALYNAGDRVYYATTKLFYECTDNGTTGEPPTDIDFWTVLSGLSVDDYVLDSDIESAFAEAKVTFNQGLFGDDAEIRLGYLYLTAHFLVNDLKTSRGGIFAASIAGLMTSRSVGNVSEGYSVPEAYMKDPTLSFYAQSAYGMKYLAMIVPRMRGNMVVVRGATLP